MPGKVTLTTPEWVALVAARHGGKYSYEKTVYTGTRNAVTITCPQHGDFVQQAHNHRNGHGCPMCANVRRREYAIRLNTDG